MPIPFLEKGGLEQLSAISVRVLTLTVACFVAIYGFRTIVEILNPGLFASRVATETAHELMRVILTVDTFLIAFSSFGFAITISGYQSQANTIQSELIKRFEKYGTEEHLKQVGAAGSLDEKLIQASQDIEARKRSIISNYLAVFVLLFLSIMTTLTRLSIPLGSSVARSELEIILTPLVAAIAFYAYSISKTPMTFVEQLGLREEYFLAVTAMLHNARSNVYGTITGLAPKDKNVTEPIIERLVELRRKRVDVRYLMPARKDRIPVAHRYRKAGANVKFHPNLGIDDLRYTVVDGKTAILAIPEKPGEKERTRRGYVVPSKSLALILTAKFEKEWNSKEAIEYDRYLRNIIREARKVEPGLPQELLSKKIGIDDDEFLRLARV